MGDKRVPPLPTGRSHLGRDDNRVAGVNVEPSSRIRIFRDSAGSYPMDPLCGSTPRLPSGSLELSDKTKLMVQLHVDAINLDRVALLT